MHSPLQVLNYCTKMSDKGRRKSSILKVTKTTPRAPLQDVNNLDTKASQDDEMTSHTAALRRRVSFRGKHYVKEFCSEADIASVLHAPEYEQEWHASTDSSGLVTSDHSNNTHSNTAISESHSTICSTTQTSVILKSVNIEDDTDPSDEIIREFKGVTASKQALQPSNPSRKTRFSFGEIKIPSEEGDVNQQHLEGDQSNSGPLQTKNILKPQASFVSSTTKKVEAEKYESYASVARGKQSHVASRSEHEDSDASVLSRREVLHTASIKVTTTEINVNLLDTQRQQSTGKLPASSILRESTGDCDQHFSKITEGESSCGSLENEVFLPAPTHFQVPNVSDKTVFDNSGMEFTAPIPGIIECGNPVLTSNSNEMSDIIKQNSRCSVQDINESDAKKCNSGFQFTESTSGQNVQNSIMKKDTGFEHPADSTICLNDSMEFTKAIPGVIELQLQAPQLFMSKDSPTRTSYETESVANTGTVSQACSKTLLKNNYTLFSDQVVSQAILQPHNVELKSRAQVEGSSIELVEDLPRNMQSDLDKQDNYKEAYQQEKNGSLSQTQVMSTSMEFTEVLPGNIQIMLDNVIPETVDAKQHPVPALSPNFEMSTSQALSRNIHTELQNNCQDVPHSETQLGCTSMEFTKVLPGNIDVEFPKENEDFQLHSEAAPLSQTQVMSTSMEFTEVLPSNIQVELRESYQDEATYERAFNKVADPTSINGNFNAENNQVKHLFQGTEVMDTQENIMFSPSRSDEMRKILSSSNKTQDLNLQVISVQEEKCDDTGLSKRITDVMPQKPGQDSTSCISKEPDRIDVRGPDSSLEGGMVQSNSICSRNSIVLNPFKPRPRLLTSPTPENVPQNPTSSELIIPESTSNALGRESITLHSYKSYEMMETNCSPKSIPPSPFLSKPCLMHSPADTEAKQSETHHNESAADTNSRSKIEESVCVLFSQDNQRGAPNLTQCMLLDVSPPFHEFSMNNTIEVTENVSESAEKMLHTTIRNAEISLRQIQSSGESEECNVKTSCMERMECDPAPNDECGSQTTNTHSLLQPENILNHSLVLDADGLRKCSFLEHVPFQDRVSHYTEKINSSPLISSNSSKRARDESSDREGMTPQKSSNQKSAKRSCGSSLDSRDNGISLSSTSSADSFAYPGAVDDIISNAQSEQSHFWVASKCEDDNWLFKFNYMDLELKVKLQPSLVAKEKIEATRGHLSFNVSTSKNSIKHWGLRILKKKLSTNQWNSDLNNSADFMLLLQKITSEVVKIRRFMVDTFMQQGLHNITITESSLSFKIGSLKCHLLFEVTFLKLDSWETYSPEDISIKNIIGDTRAVEVKNLITGVEKDAYFLRNYIRDINDYIKTMEGFCK